MLQVPPSPGQMILDDVAVRLRPLLPTTEFIKFCGKRNVPVSHESLVLFEKLRILTPVIRIMGPEDEDLVLRLDGTPTASYFDAGWIADTSAPGAAYAVPDVDDPSSMAFYSEFQVWALDRVLRDTTKKLRLDQYAGVKARGTDWNDWFRTMQDRAAASVTRLRSEPLLAAVPILCQVISNRYLPYALGNERTIRVAPTTHWGEWMEFSSHSWEWRIYCEEWDPTTLVAPFGLDEPSLQRAYEEIVVAIRDCDPLWDWSDLRRFVNQGKRDKLRGDALRAELYRQAADMLGRLHRELYASDLRPPEEMFGMVLSYIPELDVRDDPREFLQYVVNQYDLNPQPKAVLFVEGESEVVFAKAIFRGLFGAHHGVSGIEIVNLRGVDSATGNKISDRFSAIFRLVDYLHEHQTLAYIMLDNEGQARNLKEAARDKASRFEVRSRAMPHDQIHVWERTFELDNFDDAEIATALTGVANEGVQFLREEVTAVRSRWPESQLATLFRDRTKQDLNKPLLAQRLAEIAISSDTGPNQSRRSIVDFLRRINRDAARNPLPITKESWRKNQEYLDSDTG